MPKKLSETEEKEVQAPPKVYVDLATSEEDVVAYDQAGAEVVFLKRRFRTLSRANLEALSHVTRTEYQRTLKAVREEQEARRPVPRPQIIDPLGGHEGALLTVKVTDPAWAKKWHLCWKHACEQDSLSRIGYTVVRAGEDPVECGLKPAGSTFLLPDPRDRKDLDLILMKISMTTFLQHQSAVSAASQEKVKGAREKFSNEVKEESGGRLKATLEEGETEEVRLKRSDLTPA